MAQLNTTINRLSLALDSLERAVNARSASGLNEVKEIDLIRLERAIDYLIEDVESLLPENEKED